MQACAVPCCAVLYCPCRQAKKMDQPGNLRNIKRETKEAVGRAKEAARNSNPGIKVCAAGCVRHRASVLQMAPPGYTLVGGYKEPSFVGRASQDLTTKPSVLPHIAAAVQAGSPGLVVRSWACAVFEVGATRSVCSQCYTSVQTAGGCGWVVTPQAWGCLMRAQVACPKGPQCAFEAKLALKGEHSARHQQPDS